MKKDFKLSEQIDYTLKASFKTNLFFLPLHLCAMFFSIFLVREIDILTIQIIYVPLILASIGSYLFLRESKEKNKLNAIIYFSVQILIMGCYYFGITIL